MAIPRASEYSSSQISGHKTPIQISAAGARRDPAPADSSDWTETRGTSSQNYNWSGYTVQSPDYSVSMVRGSWIVPTLSCNSGDAVSYIFVGIDGARTDTVEQVGTDQDCQGGAANYFAWYEMFPAGPVRIDLAVRPGDRIQGQVNYRAENEFLLEIEDLTTGESFSTIEFAASPSRSSAEWIVEVPGRTALANFGRVTLTDSQATIGGITGPIGFFPDQTSTDMVDRAGQVKTQTFGLSQGGKSFTVVWYNQ